MRLLPTHRPRTGRTALLAAAVPTVLAASLTCLAPAHATTTPGAPAAARDQIACPRGFVCIYPDINFNGQPYVKRAVDGSVRHLPDYIRGKGSSSIRRHHQRPALTTPPTACATTTPRTAPRDLAARLLAPGGRPGGTPSNPSPGERG
ncbi:peptidase inhibitor family I36 protein [Streptomyces sp. NRRL B-3648]|uniref:peptidase inhibitor family I36 protein n=1 Tax=Streptomyces sp. NRRL B-3648 TaxID=1519493 RepID=UPI000A3E8E7D|nr:peptidase inhibitor family I36 protein [Streptomyces sp. NRRL B-3648]